MIDKQRIAEELDKFIEWDGDESYATKASKLIFAEHIAKLVRDELQPKWTKEKPTVPGWYYLRTDKNQGGVVRRVYEFSAQLYIDLGNELYLAVAAFKGDSEWAGPLPEPE